MPSISRRHFLHGSALAAAASQLPGQLPSHLPGQLSAFPRSPLWQPNNELRVACVGVRSRGQNHIQGLSKLPNVKVVAVVDVDRDVLAREEEAFAKGKYGEAAKIDTYTDLRRVLDRDDIDAISVATPNHWHALQAIWACQAGKDVYLEKPVSHNVWEGGQIVKAARQYKRIVQTGTQSRSSHGIARGIEYIASGKLGKIELARGLCYKPRSSIGKVKGPQTPPASVDYDLWCGPASNAPLQRRSLHYDWHWVHETGNGDVGNQGIHQMDIARWALGQKLLPSRTLSFGGRVGYDDDGNTPNTQIVFHEFAEGPPLLFEVRGLPRSKKGQQTWRKSMDNYRGARIGVIVHCENGFLRIPDYNRAIAFDKDGKEIERFAGSSNHYENFVAAVRSRKTTDLHADIYEGHLSSAMCHMGNVSHLLGAPASQRDLDTAAQKNPWTAEAWQRMHTHLAKNEVDTAAMDDPTQAIVLGRQVAMDPESERFVDDDANRLLKRNYRKGFVVPETV
ncbi:MAG: Gfo/Idh/MocA family protein [Planctomycetota bacterium]